MTNNISKYGKMTATWHRDQAGHQDPQNYKGTYFHPKTGGLYRVFDFEVDAQRGLWLLRYMKIDGEGDQVGDFTYAHTIDDFTRKDEQLGARFMKVDEGLH